MFRIVLLNSECEEYAVVDPSVSIVDNAHVVYEGTLEECLEWRRQRG